MPSNWNLAAATAGALADAFLDVTSDAGYECRLRIYDGTQAATADTAIGSQVLLAEFTLPDPIGTQTGGVITLDAISSVSAVATGTASWFRIVMREIAGPHTEVKVADGSVGTSNADMIVGSTSFVSGSTISIASAAITVVL